MLHKQSKNDIVNGRKTRAKVKAKDKEREGKANKSRPIKAPEGELDTFGLM